MFIHPIEIKHTSWQHFLDLGNIYRQKELVVTLMTLPYLASTYLISSLP